MVPALGDDFSWDGDDVSWVGAGRRLQQLEGLEEQSGRELGEFASAVGGGISVVDGELLLFQNIFQGACAVQETLQVGCGTDWGAAFCPLASGFGTVAGCYCAREL